MRSEEFGFTIRLSRRVDLVSALALTFAILSPSPSHAVVRHCGDDPVANTALVLCTAPSGPCDASTVVVGATITLKGGPCIFDLGGRDLRIERAVRMDGSKTAPFLGYIDVTDTRDVTIAPRGKVKMRGTFERPPSGVAMQLTVTAQGAIHQRGTLDLSGPISGFITLTADGDIDLAPRSRTFANSRTPLVDGVHGDFGGVINVFSRGGNLVASGELAARSGDGGGEIELDAVRDVTIVDAHIDVSGGVTLGGDIGASAGDHLIVTRVSFDASSGFGGGDGGSIDLSAGGSFDLGTSDTPGGIVPSGDVRVERALFDARGSSGDEFGGSGGDVFITGDGDSHVSVAADVVIRVDGSTSLDSFGGSLEVRAGDYIPVPRLDAALDFEASVSARGGRNDGAGGWLVLISGGNLVSTGDLDAVAHDGGEVDAFAGGDLTMASSVSAGATAPDGAPATVFFVAGLAREGRLVVANDVRAAAAPPRVSFSPTPFVFLAGCGVEVRPGVIVDGSVRSSNGPIADLGVEIVSGNDLVIGSGARVLAAPAGTITLTHLPGLNPTIGAGVGFDPTPIDDADALLRMPHCPHCGPGGDQPCDPTVAIDTLAPAGEDTLDASVRVASATGAPLSGTVDVCDGTGVEDLSFTWLATSCGADDLFQLTVNGTVVASVSPDSDGLGCRKDATISTYRVPLADVLPLLAPGTNSFGVRKSAGGPSEFTEVAWVSATVTVGGVDRRLVLFESLVGIDLQPYIYGDGGAIDAAVSTELCNAVISTPWSGALPCIVDLTPLAADTLYTLLVRATDAPGSSALDTADFTHASETELRLNPDGCS